MNKRIEKIKGTFIGCAVGDAMGMPTEFMPRELMAEKYPAGIHGFVASERSDIVVRTMKAGEITDDTINTVFIAEMIIDKKGVIDTESYIDSLRSWIRKNPEKSRYVNGPSTKAALEALENGVPLKRSGVRGTTNGASMKISPIGLICDYKDMDSLAKKVESICLPTHNTSVAIAGACAVAACVSYAMQGGENIRELWDVAFRAVEVGSAYGELYPGVSLQRRMEAVRNLTDECPQEEVLDKLKYFYGTGVETAESIPAVLSVITLAGGDPIKAACLSAGLGADTDTIGAISGAISGCMHPKFPETMVEQLERVNQLDFEDLARKLEPYVIKT